MALLSARHAARAALEPRDRLEDARPALADRLRAANERLLQQSFQTVAGRVASALLGQVVARQAEGAGDSDMLIEATQAEIAQLAGTSRESASRFLASLEREGVVRARAGKGDGA